MAQSHKNFTDSQVKELIGRYLRGEIKRKHLQDILNIGETRFFALLGKYQENPDKFSIQYQRSKTSRIIEPAIEQNILKELKLDKKIIDDKDTPVKSYNYSFIKKRLETKYKQTVSVPTIIDRAKKGGFYLKKRKKKTHDKEVLTNYVGELFQHDSSYHLFAPDSRQKWYLITTIDDFSRFMLYAKLVKRETSWSHIMALQNVFMKHGMPKSMYAGSHRIFRFIQDRDSLWRKHHKITDEVDTQFREALNDCSVEYIPALSPQAKGKIERPYGWIQDHLVRIRARENVTTIPSAQRILNQQVHQYNYRWVHSTTKEIPYLRLQRALKEKQSLLRDFIIKPSFLSIKDIFCIRKERTINPCRKVSIDNLTFKINGAPIGAKVNLRIYANEKTGLADIRSWCNNKYFGYQKAKISDLNSVHF